MFYMQNDQAVAAGNTSMSWESLLALIFNWWSFLFLPLGAALFATMVAAQEKRQVTIELCGREIFLLLKSGLIKLPEWQVTA